MFPNVFLPIHSMFGRYHTELSQFVPRYFAVTAFLNTTGVVAVTDVLRVLNSIKKLNRFRNKQPMKTDLISRVQVTGWKDEWVLEFKKKITQIVKSLQDWKSCPAENLCLTEGKDLINYASLSAAKNQTSFPSLKKCYILKP